MQYLKDLSNIQDDQLLQNFSQVVSQEREAISSVVAHLAEIGRRKLYAGEGFSSLFSYCVKKFNFSEESAYHRIYAARISQQFPEVLDLLDSGQLTLSAIRLIGPCLRSENKETLIKEVCNKSKRQVEKILAAFFPKEEPIADKIRKLPLPKSLGHNVEQEPTRPGACNLLNFSAVLEEEKAKVEPIVFQKQKQEERIQPVSARRVKIEFSASEELADKIERIKALLRHKHPHGKLEDIFGEILEFYLEKKAPERKIARKEQAASHRPASVKTRYIPQATRLEVWKRDEGRCSYISPDGERCSEHGFMEYDHLRPWSLGGDSTVENLRLLCRGHNQWRVKFQQKQA